MDLRGKCHPLDVANITNWELMQDIGREMVWVGVMLKKCFRTMKVTEDVLLSPKMEEYQMDQ